jgi:hypothetical protein
VGCSRKEKFQREKILWDLGLWLAAEGKKKTERNSLSFELQLKAKLSEFFISSSVETAETVCNCSSRRFASHFLELLCS